MVSEISQQVVRMVPGAASGSRDAAGVGKPEQTTTVNGEVKNLPQGGGTLPQAAAKPAPPEQLEELVSGLNELVQNIRRELQFSVDEDSGRTVIRVFNSETDELIRQIPSEEILALARNLTNGDGLLFNTKA